MNIRMVSTECEECKEPFMRFVTDGIHGEDFACQSCPHCGKEID